MLVQCLLAVFRQATLLGDDGLARRRRRGLPAGLRLRSLPESVPAEANARFLSDACYFIFNGGGGGWGVHTCLRKDLKFNSFEKNTNTARTDSKTPLL